MSGELASQLLRAGARGVCGFVQLQGDPPALWPVDVSTTPCHMHAGITGSFSGVDASGKFKQATIQFGGKPSGGGSGGGAGGSGSGAAKKRVFDDKGAWNGCCFCGVKAKVCVRMQEGVPRAVPRTMAAYKLLVRF